MDVKVQMLQVEDGWIAKCTELPGCQSWGKTEQEAFRGVDAAVGVWLDTEYEAVQWLLEHPEEDPPANLREAVERQRVRTEEIVDLYESGMLPDVPSGHTGKIIESLKDRLSISFVE